MRSSLRSPFSGSPEFSGPVPWRCQRMTVSGRTRTRCCRQSLSSRRTISQKNFVPGVVPWAALGSESDLELLAQEEILEKEIVMAAEASR